MRKWLLASVLVVSGVVGAVQAQAESLGDALAAAYKSSKLLDQNEALLRATDENVAVAVSRLRPVVNFAASSTYSSVGADPTTNTVRLVADLTLYDFGRSRLGVEIAKETVLATREALRGLEQQVLLAAVQAYVNVRLQSEIVALRQSNVRLISSQLQASRDRFEVGEVTRTDVAIAEARLASARSGLAAAEGELAVARERYKAVTGEYPGRLAPLPALPKIAKSLEAAKAIALRTHPTLLQAQRVVTVRSLAVEAAKAEFAPRITAQAQVGAELERNRDGDFPVGKSVGVTLSQTLYAGGAQSSGYRTAIAQLDAAQAGLAQTAIDVAEGVGAAWASLDVASAGIEAGRLQVEAAQTAFDGVKEEADLGARTTLDVLNAEQELLDARATRLTAEAQRYLGVYQVLAAMGLLTAEHLNLGVPLYDPSVYYNAVKSAPATSPQGAKLDRILGKINK